MDHNPKFSERLGLASSDAPITIRTEAPEWLRSAVVQFAYDVGLGPNRQPGAHDAYEKFLGLQSGPYLAHKDWLKDQQHQRSEAIRFTLLAARTKGVVKHDEWLASLTETNQKLRKPLPTSQKALL